MRKALLAVFAATALWFGLDDWRQRSIDHPPGILVAEIPQQREISSSAIIQKSGYTLTPRATFRLTARILAAERYRLSRASDLMPRDLALGWGVMSDSAVLDQLKISQGDRFYFWRTKTSVLPAPLDLISASSANMHLIAANPDVAKVIDRARVGQLISFKGRLVDVLASDGGQMRTSLTRDDSGAGACEIVYVEEASLR